MKVDAWDFDLSLPPIYVPFVHGCDKSGCSHMAGKSVSPTLSCFVLLCCTSLLFHCSIHSLSLTALTVVPASATLPVRWETWYLLSTPIDRMNKEDTTNNFSSQIKNKMLSTLFEIIFYFYYWYFASS
jgi:hypothetical protein